MDTSAAALIAAGYIGSLDSLVQIRELAGDPHSGVGGPASLLRRSSRCSSRGANPKLMTSWLGVQMSKMPCGWAEGSASVVANEPGRRGGSAELGSPPRRPSKGLR